MENMMFKIRKNSQNLDNDKEISGPMKTGTKHSVLRTVICKIFFLINVHSVFTDLNEK